MIRSSGTFVMSASFPITNGLQGQDLYLLEIPSSIYKMPHSRQFPYLLVTKA